MVKHAAIGIAAKGMVYIHQQGVVMRDPKPDNVGFDNLEGKPKIFDLGDLPRGPHNYPERYF
jgi:serine/threonine protein kinase